MKKYIVIGDVHGSKYWKEIISNSDYNHIVFLGDYLDPYSNIENNDLIENFIQIIKLKIDNPNDVTLILGNHDLHYFSSHVKPCSRYNKDIAPFVCDIFNKHVDLFQYAFQYNNVIFTHAGISNEWFLSFFKGNPKINIAEQLNKSTDEQMHILCQAGKYRGGDLESIGGIFWADRRELTEPLYGYTQIVGHSRVPEIIIQKGEHNNDIIFCDCLHKKRYLSLLL